MAGPIIRMDVYGLAGPWHPVLKGYALAVRDMKGRDPSDTKSLRYQADVHGVGDEDDPPPDAFRSQCQHNCWYFLPWHRWYLWHYEAIIRSILKGMTDLPEDVAAIVDTWALPYWDYSRTGSTDRLPPEFAAPKDWNGDDNPLYVPDRREGVNSRQSGVSRQVAVPSALVLGQPYTGIGDAATFGGTQSGWHHFQEPGSTTGGLEATPHNAVHGFVGGFMSRFSTAGLDPVFYLHHCNIDRYWEVRGHGLDPADLGGLAFDFHDATGAPVQNTSANCVDTVNQLGYKYEDTEPPEPPTEGVRRRTRRSELEPPPPPPPDLPTEVVGVTDGPTLSGDADQVNLRVGAPSGQFRDARGGESEPSRVFLTVDGIQGEEDPGISYGVYVSRADDEHLAGFISFFGIHGTARGERSLGYSFDVTDIVGALRDEDEWDPDDVDVHFEPVDDEGDAPPSESRRRSVRVGSVKFLFQ